MEVNETNRPLTEVPAENAPERQKSTKTPAMQTNKKSII